MERDHALRLIYDALDEVNRQLPSAKRLAKKPETPIIGPGGALDSMGVVSFVMALEERVGDNLARSVQLLDESALADPTGPFQTVGSLAHYLSTLAGDAK